MLHLKPLNEWRYLQSIVKILLYVVWLCDIDVQLHCTCLICDFRLGPVIPVEHRSWKLTILYWVFSIQNFLWSKSIFLIFPLSAGSIGENWNCFSCFVGWRMNYIYIQLWISVRAKTCQALWGLMNAHIPNLNKTYCMLSASKDKMCGLMQGWEIFEGLSSSGF